MTAPAWVVSWLAVGLLGVFWYVLIEVAPACNRSPSYDCDAWTDAGVFFLGIPALVVAVLVALGVSIRALFRGGSRVLAWALIVVTVLLILSVVSL
jgi:FtsH-binding integral membrane protein